MLTLIVAFPPWARSKVFALPIAMSLVPQPPRADQGEKECKGREKIHQNRPKPKHDRIIALDLN